MSRGVYTEPSRARAWAVYLTLYVVATLMLGFASRNPAVRVAHGVLVYLVLIIGASRQGGRGLSATLVVLGYLAVDFLLVPPKRSFGSASELDWLILIGFAATGIFVSALFDQLRVALAFARDRTLEVERLSAERLQLEREAATARVMREANRLKNTLLRSIAHDLRSPVATLALLADPASGFASDRALSRVAEESQRLGAFLNMLQRFAGADDASLLLSTHDVAELVQIAVKSSEALLTGREVPIHVPEAGREVRCDLTLSVQVLGNLLQNAARYSPPASPIEVFCAAVDDNLEIVVADRGPGIAAEDLVRLFTPLQRAPGAWNDAASKQGRMGMGLSISRTFARAQGGDVQHRPRDGGGSLFVLTLPRA
ncbi:ATP-binding protein, partial [Gemmatimonas sp.]|uniref:sensor histidine kinase n=1 Tax=Gemmatimonas sp. TaxID=1962908 RepID=UPI0035634DEF